jgi:hypothetical protein
MNTTFDLYTDYLLSSFGQTTATSLAQLLDGALSHDEVTRFLNQSHVLGQTLWKHVKPLVRQVQSPAGVLIVDDSFLHKPHSQPNALVKVYFDHSQQAYVKAINFVTLLYRVEQALLPVGLHVVTNTLQEPAPGEAPVWRAAKTKNEAFRDLLQQAHQNAIPFTYVLADSWYTNAANINAVRGLDKHWLGAVKANVTVALTAADRAAGRFVPLSQLPLAVGAPQCVYLRSVAAPVLVCKDILPNKDGSVGEQLLLTTDTASTYQQILTTYQQRWGIEDYHKSLKQNASLQKSPARRVQAQTTHLLASVCAFVKLEALKLRARTNPYALKARLYLQALKAAFTELQNLKTNLLTSQEIAA